MRRFGPLVFSFLGGVVGAIAFLGLVAARPKAPSSDFGTFKHLSADFITAHQIDVVGDDGHIVASALSGPMISLASKGDVAEVSLGAFGSGAHVSVSGGGLSPSVDLGFVKGKVGIDLSDAGGQTRVTLGQTSLVTKSSGVTEDTPVGSITVFDEVGNVVWRSPR